MTNEYKFIGTEQDLLDNGFYLSNSINGYKNKVYHKRIVKNKVLVDTITIYIKSDFIDFKCEDSLKDLVDKGVVVKL